MGDPGEQNVITGLRFGDDGAVRRIIEGQGKPVHCVHRRVFLNSEERTLRCQQCDALVDPFVFLATLMESHDRWAEEGTRLEKRAIEAKEELRLTKGRLQRARKALAEAESEAMRIRVKSREGEKR